VEEVLLLCALAFLAGLVDAIAGGGGLIQVPALFAVFPTAAPAALLGTNKVSSIAGTLAASMRYARELAIEWPQVIAGASLAAIAGALGAWTVAHSPATLVRPMVLVLLVVVLTHLLVHPRLGLAPQKLRKPRPGAEATFGMGLGFYDGFFGPGAGAFLMFGLVRWFRHSFLEAAARARVLNLASNAGALSVFLAGGNVDLTIGIPMAAANILGGYTGAAAAVRHGSAFVRGIFLAVVAALIAKLTWDWVH
jgi:uncharacterized membrane protein YfcA